VIARRPSHRLYRSSAGNDVFIVDLASRAVARARASCLVRSAPTTTLSYIRLQPTYRGVMVVVRFMIGIAALVAFAVVAAPAASVADTSSARLAFVRDGSVFVAAANGGTATPYLRATSEKGTRTAYSLPAWSPDGKRLAVREFWQPPPDSELHERSSLVVFRLRGVSPPAGRILADTPGRSSWSPNGRHLVYCAIYGFNDPPDEHDCDLRIVDVATGSVRKLTSSHTDGDPAWSPDGALIAYEQEIPECAIDPDLNVVCPPRGLFVIAPTGGKARRLTRMVGKNPSWSPDGRFIAFDDGRRIGIVGRRGGAVRFLAIGTDPAWSTDGDVIAFARNKDVWLVAPSGTRPRLAFRNAAEPAWRRIPR
jgi:dipeptidyl aminopeptidase/acylaminoacyl peptidase